MKYLGTNSVCMDYMEKNGEAWENHPENPDHFNLACECCAGSEVKKVMHELGLTFGSNRDNSNPPTKEEYETVILPQKEAFLKAKDVAENSVNNFRKAINFIKEGRYADCKVFCELKGVDFYEVAKHV